MKYRKKPVVIEAVQYNGNNLGEITAFVGVEMWFNSMHNYPFIKTLEGEMKININDFIIKGIKGEFYPCKPDIFAETYEAIKGEEMDEVKETITVCSECLSEACWKGELYCDDYKTAGIVEIINDIKKTLKEK